MEAFHPSPADDGLLHDHTIDDWMFQPGSIPLEEGRMISDRVQLERLLGEGGMGCVWIAQHLTLGTRVAVKFVSPGAKTVHAELRQRFLREAAAVAKVSCPHVVRTFDFGVMHDGTPFLVMELLAGESLGERLRRVGALGPREASLIVTQTANALTAAHGAGVVHRDVKPGNVFLTHAGRDTFAKLLDFGIAKDVEMVFADATKSGCVLGTPQYMSPERLVRPKCVDEQIDLWALAVTAYEAIVGAPPFRGSNMPQIVESVLGRRYAPPSTLEHPPLVGDRARLDAFFARAFADDKFTRFASALELADAFGFACASERAPSPTRPSHVPLVPPTATPVPNTERSFADTWEWSGAAQAGILCPAPPATLSNQPIVLSRPPAPVRPAGTKPWRFAAAIAVASAAVFGAAFVIVALLTRPLTVGSSVERDLTVAASHAAAERAVAPSLPEPAAPIVESKLPSPSAPPELVATSAPTAAVTTAATPAPNIPRSASIETELEKTLTWLNRRAVAVKPRKSKTKR